MGFFKFVVVGTHVLFLVWWLTLYGVGSPNFAEGSGRSPTCFLINLVFTHISSPAPIDVQSIELGDKFYSKKKSRTSLHSKVLFFNSTFSFHLAIELTISDVCVKLVPALLTRLLGRTKNTMSLSLIEVLKQRE